MKKLAALALAVMMTVGAVGCSESGNDSSDVPGKLSNSSLGFGYRNLEKRTIKALEYSCGAKEMSTGNKQKYIQDSKRYFDECFEGGVYVTLTSEDIRNMDLEDDIDGSINPNNVENMFVFRKNVKHTYIDVRVYEISDEKNAKKSFNAMADSLEEEQEEFGSEMVIVREHDNNLTYMYNVFGIMAYGYFEKAGKTITSIGVMGSPEDDIYDEFYLFLSEMKYTDMVDFMDEVSN